MINSWTSILLCSLFVEVSLVDLMFWNGGDDEKEEEHGWHLFVLLGWFECFCHLRWKHHSEIHNTKLLCLIIFILWWIIGDGYGLSEDSPASIHRAGQAFGVDDITYHVHHTRSSFRDTLVLFWWALLQVLPLLEDVLCSFLIFWIPLCSAPIYPVLNPDHFPSPNW